MASAIIFIQWENYISGVNGRSFFSSTPLMFSTRQERLHLLKPSDRLWLVSRCTDDHQYYFVGALSVAKLHRNPPESKVAQRFGEFAVIADDSSSHDFERRFPAEGIIRAFEFDGRKPVQLGASLGRSLMTLRILTDADEFALNIALPKAIGTQEQVIDMPFGLWTKCDAVFANYFLTNWNSQQTPLAFMLYDSPPVLPKGAPVFIHSDKNIRLLASFQRSEFIAGYKPTVDANERVSERERFWSEFRAPTLNPPTKENFDSFWDAQHGVRSMFVMDNIREFPVPMPFKSYGRALEWGYPMGVGYRYLSYSQSILLLRQAELSVKQFKLYIPNDS